MPIRMNIYSEFLSFVLTLLIWLAYSIEPENVINLGNLLTANDASARFSQENTQILQSWLNSPLAHGKHFKLPAAGTYYLNRGIHVVGLRNSVIEINGRLSFRYEFNDNYDPGLSIKKPASCFSFYDISNVTLTSSSSGLNRGVIDGGGPRWYGLPFIGYLQRKENRPYLLHVNRSQELLIERLLIQEAPFYTLKLSNVNGVEIRELSIVNRRTLSNFHTLLDLSAFNTDGIDIDGHNVWIHDVDIWNQDDCIAVKDNDDKSSSNMTFERIHASGLGLVIGSIGETTVKNITFRDSVLYRTVKGIYMKFRVSDKNPNIGGIIENIVFRNITIESPMQWPIWVGPAQQAGGLCYPFIPFARCDSVTRSIFRNIYLENLVISNPIGSPGIFLGSDLHPIENIVLNNVTVRQGEPLIYPSDLYELFPGLAMTIQHDQYALDGKNYFYLVCVVVMFMLICRYFIQKHLPKRQKYKYQVEVKSLLSSPTRARTWSEEKKRIKKPVPSDGPRDRYWIQVKSSLIPLACFLLSSLIFCLLLHYLFITRKVHNLSEYFLCENVLNGTASGSTWPIPSCFVDHTTMKPKQAVKNIEAAKESWLIGGFIFLFVVTNAIIYFHYNPVNYQKKDDQKSYTSIKFIPRSPSMQCIHEHEEFADFDFP